MIVIGGVCVLGTVLFGLSLFIPNDEKSDDSQEKLLNEVLYNDSFLGYNSTSWGAVFLPVGVSDDLSFPDIENMTLPIYCYNAVDFQDEKYIKSVIDRFFPEVDLDEMELVLEADRYQRSPYLTIVNESCEIHLLRSGAVKFKDKQSLSFERDVIGCPENVTKLAYCYLADHGGVPPDIGKVVAQPLEFMTPDGTFANGSYYVRFYRQISDYNIYGFPLCNQILMKFDAVDGHLIEMEWHWPDLDYAINLTDFPSAKSLIGQYGMNSTADSRSNISKILIEYYLPPLVQESAYDTHSDVYFIPPYLKVSIEDGRFYFLGMIKKEEHST